MAQPRPQNDFLDMLEEYPVGFEKDQKHPLSELIIIIGIFGVFAFLALVFT